MKNILIPTDYSPNARNAAEYAIHLAKATGASVEFLHVFHMPEFINELPVNPDSVKQLMVREKAKINKEAKMFRASHGVKIKTLVYPGELSEVLRKIMAKDAADVVIVGMKGTSVVDRYFWGNTTTGLIKKSAFPLMVIPSKTKFTPWRHITLAADYESLIGESSINLLKYLSQCFKAKIQAVHVAPPEDELVEVVERSESERYFKRVFEGLRVTYTNIEADVVTKGLVEFINSKGSDLVVMIPQKHNFWQSLFVGSTTRKMAFSSTIPLLVLPGKGEKR